MTHVYIETYGCQMNEADSETVAGLLSGQGFELVGAPSEADAILVNTCAVREHAEERVLGRIGELAQYKHARPDVVIGVLGCMAQHLKDSLLRTSRFVDIVAGPDSYRRLPAMIDQARTGRLVDVRLDHSELYDDIVPCRREGVTAWLTVQRGCDKHCTFCIVPAVRGRERCVPMDELVRQTAELTESGVREVCLLGQTVNSYNDGRHDFADLLQALAAIPELLRIRFTSPYPTDFTDRVIDCMAREEKVARHVHLPLQSASNKVLERARRRYNIEEFDDILNRLRSAIPGLAVSTDIIVGFHGEGEVEFQARFDFAFMFKYSRRSQTSAWRWNEDIDEETKTRRLKHIIDLQESISREIQQACVGQTVKVLVEGPSSRDEGQLFGRTSEFRQVVIAPPSDSALRGDLAAGCMVDVRVFKATGHTMLGEYPARTT